MSHLLRLFEAGATVAAGGGGGLDEVGVVVGKN